MSAPAPESGSDDCSETLASDLLTTTIVLPEPDETTDFELTSIGELDRKSPKQAAPSEEIGSYDSQKSHDSARRAIAYWLLGLLTFLIFAAFISYATLYFGQPTASSPKTDDLLALVQLILTPLLTLVSAATGFYFGAHHSQRYPAKD